MSIAETVKELRTSNGMSQENLADKLNVSRDLVSKWECGARRPDYRMIEKMAEIFKVSADAIIDKKNFAFSELVECFPNNDIEEEVIKSILNDFLHSQTARNADVFIKRYYYQKSITEISNEYGIRENHIRSILSKTRNRLKKYVKEWNK